MNISSNKRSLLEDWEEVYCILCGANPATLIVWPDATRGDIVRCCQCGLLYRNPRRQEEYLRQHFAEEWTEARPAFFLEEYRDYALQRIAGLVKQHHPHPGALLDIGSSYGNLLMQFTPSWRRVGVEPSVRACQIAQQRLPDAQILNCMLAEAIMPEASFDVITMVDTIYYLPHPLSELIRIKNLLRPGGILVIECQNFLNRGLIYRLIGHHYCDNFMYFYNRKSLSKILNKIGMQVIDLSYFPGCGVGNKSQLLKNLLWVEFYTLRMISKVSRGLIDFVPRFVLVAKLNEEMREI